MAFLDNTGLAYFWSKLKALFATKSELEVVRQSASKAYHYKGSVAAVSDLPANAEQGDVYNVGTTLDGDNYAWTGTAWDKLGASVDLSPYALDANVVKLSGNQTVGGTKTFSSAIVVSSESLKRSANTSYIRLEGGTSTSDGSYLDIFGQSHSNYPGWFRLYANNGSASKALIGKPDGTLTWDSKDIAIDENVVHKTGDETIGGTKTFTSGIHGNTSELRVQNDKSGDDGSTTMYGGANYQTGAYVQVYGKSHSSRPGQFFLVATNGTNTKTFRGNPDGTLQWGGKDIAIDENVVHKTGDETIDGVKTFSSGPVVTTTAAFKRSVNNSYLNIYGGTAYGNGAFISLHGKDDTNAGNFVIRASDGTSNKELIGKPDGTLQWDGKDFVYTSGTQTVGGEKTFTSNPKVQNGFPALDINRTSGSTNPIDIRFAQDGVNIAAIRLGNNKDLQIGAKAEGDYWYSGPQFYLQNDGKFRLIAQKAGTAKSLVGAQDGTLTWDGKGFVFDSGDQTIGGVKVFSDVIRSTATTLAIINPNITKGTAPDAQRNTDIIFTEKVSDPLGSIAGGRVMARIRNIYTTAGNNGITLQIFKPTSGSTTTKQVSFRAMADGTYNLVPESADISLGLNTSTTKWKEIWCAQSSINTSSDERIKQQIANIPDAVLDAWGDVEWIQFKYNDAVAEKGASQARLHNGLIAQRVDDAFKTHGLDASQYGLFLYDAWEAQPEEKDEDGTVIQEAQPAGDGYGLRYTEALCMEAAYQRRRADRAEARITVLERRLDEMEAAIASLISPVA